MGFNPEPCAPLQLWDLLALMIVYYACTRWGGPWLRDNWPAVAGPVAGALFVAEVELGQAQRLQRLLRRVESDRTIRKADMQQICDMQQTCWHRHGGVDAVPDVPAAA